MLDLPPHLVRDLLEQPLVASLGTFNVDGSIHLVAVWFLWDGSGVLVGTSGASRKARNVVRDPRATIMIHDSPGGMDVRGVTLAGRAELLRGDEALARNDAIHEKYVDRTALTLPNIREFLAFDDVTIRLTPERTSFWDETGTRRRPSCARAAPTSGPGCRATRPPDAALSAHNQRRA